MLRAVSAAYSLGELVIPHPRPKALRLDFQGLRGALRAEGNAEEIDALTFQLQDNPPALILRLKETTENAQAINAALAAIGEKSPPVPPSPDLADSEAALSRILGNI